MALDLSQWPGLVLGERFEADRRPSMWTGSLDGEKVAIKRFRRSEPSTDWELGLINFLCKSGFGTAEQVLTLDGKLHSQGIAVGRWQESHPPSNEAEWRAVVSELKMVHEATIGYQQRPDSCAVTELREHRRSVDVIIDMMPVDVQVQILEVFEEFGSVEQAVVHGNPALNNVGIDAAGKVCLYDWDNSRVDVVWHDFGNLGVQVLNDEEHLRAQVLHFAWEVANWWNVAPEHALGMLSELTTARKRIGK